MDSDDEEPLRQASASVLGNVAQDCLYNPDIVDKMELLVFDELRTKLHKAVRKEARNNTSPNATNVLINASQSNWRVVCRTMATLRSVSKGTQAVPLPLYYTTIRVFKSTMITHRDVVQLYPFLSPKIPWIIKNMPSHAYISGTEVVRFGRQSNRDIFKTCELYRLMYTTYGRNWVSLLSERKHRADSSKALTSHLKQIEKTKSELERLQSQTLQLRRNLKRSNERLRLIDSGPTPKKNR